MKSIYGPVPSRRLGLSLGVDIVTMKTCSLSCVYCQIGRTPETTVIRKEYVPVGKVLGELEHALDEGVRPDWITFSGSGEPTLNSGIGTMIDGIRDMTDIPICVITNGTLLWDETVRSDILGADAVMPSLDGASREAFERINRPHPSLKIEEMIDGLVRFRKEFTGKIWLEIMLVGGMNDSEEELRALREAARRIAPDSIQLNTVVRPPAESYARPLSRERLMEIRDFFGERAEIIASFKGDAGEGGGAGVDDVREYLKRRPGSIGDISGALGIDEMAVEELVDLLEKSGEIVLREHFGKRYWEYARRPDSSAT